MNLADLGTLRDRLTEAAEAMGAKPIGDAGLKAWLHALRDFRLDAVVDAIDSWLQTRSKMPVPADIRQICTGRLGDRIESKAAADKAEYAAGARTILASAATRDHALARIWAVLKRRSPASLDVDTVLAASKAMALRDDQIPL